ncbi:MAG TPA: hypothetical protein VFM33_12895 [Aquabacterium sp.]|nr:hypothetical protein [Aquabacterium sp.]
MAKNRETRTVQNPALLAAGSRPDVLAWRQQCGLFYTKQGNPVFIGLPGMSDCGMIVRTVVTQEMVGKTIGVAVQPEFKTQRGQQSEAQGNWQAAVEARGGIYRIVRSAEDMNQLIEDVQNGRW